MNGVPNSNLPTFVQNVYNIFKYVFIDLGMYSGTGTIVQMFDKYNFESSTIIGGNLPPF